jgi:ketoreductase RED1
MPEAQQEILNRYRKTAIIGAGVIGGSWTALFLARGLEVVVNDPRPDVDAFVRDYIRNNLSTLEALGLSTANLKAKLRFEADLEKTVADADLVQENGPERVEFKQCLWARIGKAVGDKALLLSSSSAKIATEQALKCPRPERLLVGHPFNPPHLIPLVEVVPGEKTSEDAVTDAVAFYAPLGKEPRVVRKEMSGFVANRLQRAIFRECCYLVIEGVVTVDELDDIVTSSVGLRWAADGPFCSFHLGGGPGGFKSFFNQFGGSLNSNWKTMAAGGSERDGPEKDPRAGGSVLCGAPGGAAGKRPRRQAARDHPRVEIDQSRPIERDAIASAGQIPDASKGVRRWDFCSKA